MKDYNRNNTLYSRLLAAAGDGKLPLLDNKTFESMNAEYGKDEMRKNLNQLDIDGKVVIGEGELDEAPMLYIGEKLGTGEGPSIDIAVDPLEGTNFAANNLPGALSVLAISAKGNLFNAPETYMDKLAVSNDVPFDATDLDFSIEKNIKNIKNLINVIYFDMNVYKKSSIKTYSLNKCIKQIKSIKNLSIPVFIGGGINESKAKQIISILKPDGIDVSRSLKNTKNIISSKKLKNFLKEIAVA